MFLLRFDSVNYFYLNISSIISLKIVQIMCYDKPMPRSAKLSHKKCPQKK